LTLSSIPRVGNQNRDLAVFKEKPLLEGYFLSETTDEEKEIFRWKV